MGITPRQFESLKLRAKGRSAKTAHPSDPSSPTAANRHRVILGIDPSLRGTGYGVIRKNTPCPDTLVHGTIKAPRDWVHSRCLAAIVDTLTDVLQTHQPDVCIMEGLFFAQNLKTALTMGEARGAALATVARAGLEVYEIAPRKMKQAIVGYGAAQKDAVARMVQRMLNLKELPAPDEADALALALAHAQDAGRRQWSPPKPI